MNKNKASVNRQHDKSTKQKLGFALMHLAIVLFCTWLVFANGLKTIGNLFGNDWQFADLLRAKILVACAWLYYFRHILTLFYLLQRKVMWSEVLGLIGFFAAFEIGLLLLGGGVFRDYTIPLGELDAVALVLLIFGSYLNSYSEMQRKWWKKDPANKGHCYTLGLFKHSMHINFFGDVLLFSGWALFTANFWSLGLPLLMLTMFVFLHIPGLDAYLANRYGKEFENYAKTTKKLIPFIY